MIKLASLLVVAAAACTPPPPYVADVRYEGGVLMQDKCDFSQNGRATNACHSEPVEGAPVAYEPPDPAQLEAARQAASVKRPRRPPPDQAAVDHALASPGVRDSVGLCRKQYAPVLDPSTYFTFTLQLAPDGKITITPHDTQAPPAFVECASAAMQGANLTSFDGAPVSFEQKLVW